MFKKTLLATALTLLPLASFTSSAAEDKWIGGFGHSSFSEDIHGTSLDVSTLNVVAGYQFHTSENLSIIPQISYGFGFDDDKIGDVKLKIDRFLTLSARGQYQWDNSWFVYGQPSYANIKVKAELAGVTAEHDEWEFGGAVGFGYTFANGQSLELGVEHFDGSEVLTAGLRFAF